MVINVINLSNIQHFSVGDGDGIRTTVFLKGCNLRCPWCHNPENLTSEPVCLNYKELGKKETVGKLVNANDIIPELLEDRDFYETSGGGVTFSGGEPMLQAEEIFKLTSLLKKNGISVLIDTAGCVPYDLFKITNPVVDTYLFDFKTADREKYKMIGGDIDLVTANMSSLLADGIPFKVRIPLIPGFNTDTVSVREMCETLGRIGISKVELIPFHRLGISKYEAMGMNYPYKDIKPIPSDELEKITAVYKEFFTVKTE